MAESIHKKEMQLNIDSSNRRIWSSMSTHSHQQLRREKRITQMQSQIVSLASAYECRPGEIVIAVLQHTISRFCGVQVPQNVSMTAISDEGYTVISISSSNQTTHLCHSIHSAIMKLKHLEDTISNNGYLNIGFSLREDTTTSETERCESRTEYHNINFDLQEIPEFLLTVCSVTENMLEFCFSSENDSDMSTVERFTSHFRNIFKGLIESDYPADLFSLPVVPQQEFQVTNQQLNETKTFLGPNETLLHDMFENAAMEMPNEIALICNSEEMTYSELDEKSEIVAYSISSSLKGSVRCIIGVCIPPSMEMIIAVLGILKSGNAYVPLDPNYPAERLSYMIENSETKIILVTTKTPQHLISSFPRTLNIDQEGETLASANVDMKETKSINADDLAYVIYTSGSTGKPKGVMINHRNAVNTIRSINSLFNVTFNDILIMVASLSFDLSVYDIFGILAQGGKILIPIVAIPGKPDPDEWVNLMEKHHVTIWNSAPAVMNLLMNFCECEESVIDPSLRIVLLSGDKIPLQLPSKIKCMVDGIEVISLGGATEGSIWSIYYPIQDVDPTWTTIPYGKPLPNQLFYILDEYLNPVPYGAIGELFIGGQGVAMGYINNNKATEKAFMTNPHAGGRLYKTGDLGRYLSDGNIEFCGRIDNQVKIRGFRIELGEIESSINSHKGIKDVIVLMCQKKLFAYILREEKCTVLVDDLKSHISNQLPEYMMPSTFIFMDSFPVTANGKIDYKSLQKSTKVHECTPVYPCKSEKALNGATELNDDKVSVKDTKSQSKHASSIREIVKRIWSDVLGTNSNTLTDESSFFKIGGDSISAMNATSAARKEGIYHTVQDIFQNPTIEGLCNIAKSSEKREQSVKNEIVEGIVPLSPIQSWFFEKGFTNMNYWNQSFLLNAKETLEAEKLKACFKRIVDHHDMLRARFHSDKENDSWSQRVCGIDNTESKDFVLQCIAINDESEMLKHIENLQRNTDIESGPLLVVGLFDDHMDNQWLFITVHHLVIDLVSWHILLEDLETAYKGKPLPEKTTSFQQWTLGLHKYVDDVETTNQEQNIIRLGFGKCLDIPDHCVRGSTSFTLNSCTTDALNKTINDSHGSNINSLLLGTLVSAYEHVTGNTALTVDVEGHGRGSFWEDFDVSHTIGWFTVIFPIQLEISKSKNLIDTISDTYSSFQKGQQNGIHQMALKQKAKANGYNSNSDVLFNFFGKFEQIEHKSSLWKTNCNFHNGDDLFEVGEKMTHALTIDCFIQNGELTVKCSFNSAAIETRQVLGLATEWQETLKSFANSKTLHHLDSHYTITNLPSDNISIQMVREVTRSSGINREDIEDMYTCTPLQSGFIYSLLKDKSMYVVQDICMINGYLDFQKFRKSLQILVDRHESLRTHFVINREIGCVQVVRKKHVPTICFESQPNEEKNTEVWLHQFLELDRQTGFDISQPLIRFAIYKETETKHLFITTFHHSILDGWSLELLRKELYGIYNNCQQTKSVKFADFIYQMCKMQANDLSAAFWKQYLKDFCYSDLLPIPKKTVKESSYKSMNLDLPDSNIVSLTKLSEQLGITTSNIICGAWAVLLGIYSGQEDVVFGLTVSGRMGVSMDKVKDVIGMCVSTLPVRVKLHDKRLDLLCISSRIQESLVKMVPHEHFPLSEIKSACQLTNNDILFQTIVTFQNFGVEVGENGSSANGIKWKILEQREHTEYPLSVIFALNGKHVNAKVIFDQAVFTQRNIENLVCHLNNTIACCITSKGTTLLQDIDILSINERKQIEIFTGKKNISDNNKNNLICAHQMIEQNAINLPLDHVAIQMGNMTLTYNELNASGNFLAKRIKAITLGQNQKCTPIGLFLMKSIEMSIGILGIHKAGGAYVPIDASLPKDRICYIIEDSECNLILTTRNQVKYLKSFFNGAVMIISESVQEKPCFLPNVESNYNPDDLAYMIYTSGTTGKPKGVQIVHKGLKNIVSCNEGGLLGVTPDSRVMQFFSIGFDACTFEIFMTLCHGGTLVISNENFVDTMEHVDTICITPSVLANLNPEDFPNIKTILSCGEMLPLACAKRWGKRCRLLNGYGPTETTICSHISEYSGNDIVTVGKPLPNTFCCILDHRMAQVPIGVTGVLFIGGVGLARGYKHLPELTRRYFDKTILEGETLYRTGDLARWTENGEVEIMGRADNQIKLRGYRIELEEIASQIKTYPNVQQAIVVVQSTKNTNVDYLVAHAVTNREVNGEDIKNYLQSRLPSFMIPQVVFCMEKFPLTINNKVDTASLPRYSPSANTKTVEAHTEFEKEVLNAYRSTLDVPSMGMTDSFFYLGGHSILAIKLKDALKERTNIDINVTDILSYPTPKRLIDKMIKQPIDQWKVPVKIESVLHKTQGMKSNVINGGEWPASPFQQQMCILHELQSDSPVYNVPLTLEITGTLDVRIFEQSLHNFIADNSATRTHFCKIDDSFYQIVTSVDDFKLPFRINDLSNCKSQVTDAKIQDYISKETQKVFDLYVGPLVKFNLLKVTTNHFLFICCFHHSIADGHAINLFIDQICEKYDHKITHSEHQSRDPKPQLFDFSESQRLQIDDACVASQMQYWKGVLEELPPLLILPLSRPRPPIPSYRGASVTFDLPLDDISRLKMISSRNGCTLFTSLVCVYKILLQQYSGMDDFAIGTVFSGRHHIGTSNIFGSLVNTIPVRIGQMCDGFSFENMIKTVQQMITDVMCHQDIPFHRLVEGLDIPRDLSYHPVFQAAIVLQENIAKRTLNGIEISMHNVPQRNAKFDILLEFQTMKTSLKGNFVFNTDIFDQWIIENMADQLMHIIHEVTVNPLIPIERLTPVSDKQMESLMKYGQKGGSFQDIRCVHEYFEEQVNKLPLSHIALKHNNESYSYSELNSSANAIASHLKQHGVTKNKLVPIVIHRSFEMVAGIIGTLKSGGAYVPVDISWPVKRIQTILQDCSAHVILTTTEIHEKFGHAFNEHHIVLHIDQLINSIGVSFDYNINETTPYDLAYVMYTSGTTGKPKGVQIAHIGLCNLLSFKPGGLLGVSKTSHVLQFFSIAFDGCALEMFNTLCHGGTLVLCSEDIKSDIKSVSLACMTPSMLSMLDPEWFPDLKTVFIGGEACTPGNVEKWTNRVKLVNMYGLTEITICSHLGQIDHSCSEITVGKPIPNTLSYIVDNSFRLVPVGATGELVIGGIGVSLGYLNRNDLNKESFVNNPFGKGRLYRTGDLAKWDDKGEIIILGRKDNQIKVRGFRVEVGEIEKVAHSHDSINNVKVLFHEANIIMFVTPVLSGLQVDNVKLYLQQHLPSYMVPNKVHALQTFPQTSNGKLDTCQLMKYLTNKDNKQQSVSIFSQKEAILTSIWVKVLNTESRGIDKDSSFFALGGDSVSAIQVASMAKKQGLHITLIDILRSRSLQELASTATTVVKSTEYVVNEHTYTNSDIPLTPIQHWFFEQDVINRNHFNQGTILNLKAKIDMSKLKNIFESLVQIHEILRCQYKVTDDGLRQIILPKSQSGRSYKCFEYTANNRKDMQGCIEKLQDSLDISSGHLIAVGLIEFGKQFCMAIIIHHLVVDLVSWRIILEDLEALCEGRALQKPTTSFQEWSVRLNSEFANSITRESWQNNQNHRDGNLYIDKLAKETPTLETRDVVGSTLSRAATSNLLSRVSRWTTINDLLLTALIWSYQITTERSMLNVDLEGHGREPWADDIDLSRTVGWFTTFCPIMLSVNPDNIGKTLRDTKQTLKNVQNKGIPYFVLRYLKKEPGLENESSDVLFNYHGSTTLFSNSFDLWDIGDTSLVQMSGVPRNEKMTHKLCVECGIIDGELKTFFIFSHAFHQKTTIERWAKEWICALEQLSNCSSCDLDLFIPSHFPLLNISGDSLTILSQEHLQPQGLTHENITDIYPSSPLQEGLVYSLLLNRSSYLVQCSFNIKGQLTPDVLKTAWCDVAKRHDILRTRFVLHRERGVLLQVVKNDFDLDWSTKDWTHLANSHVSRKNSETSFLRQDREQGFSLSKAMIRFSLFKLTHDSHWFVLTFHHALLDGWSISLLLRDVGHAINGVSFEPAPQFRSYIESLSKQELHGTTTFWREQLENITPSLITPDITTTGHQPNMASLHRELAIRPRSVHNFTKQHDLSVPTVFYGTWAIVLKQMLQSNFDSVTFGIVLSCRDSGIKDIGEVAGMLINTLPMTIRFPKADNTLSDWFNQIKSQQIDVMSHSMCSLTDIHRWSGIPLNKKLFDTVIAYENYPPYQNDNESSITFQDIEGHEQTEYGLAVAVAENKDAFAIKLMYDTTVISNQYINALIDNLELSILNIIQSNSSTLLSRLYGVNKFDHLKNQVVEKCHLQQSIHDSSQVMKPTGGSSLQSTKENLIKGIWSSILNVPKTDIDKTDSFFELGGTSLSALIMVSLAKDKKLSIRIDQIMRCPTLESLAKEVSFMTGTAAQEEDMPLTCLHEKGKALFFKFLRDINIGKNTRNGM